MTLVDNLRFNFIRDIAPVARLNSVYGAITVHPSFPAKTVPELIAMAKASPGRITMGAGGIGSATHLYGALFTRMAAIDLLFVQYRGEAPALSDLIAGQIQVVVPTLIGAIEHIKSGTLRALGVTNATRSPLLPDVPTIGELVPGYEAT